MNYLGKVVGGLAGLISGKWPLVLFGVLLGHQFDRGFAKYSAGRLPRDFSSLAFAIMGHMAKADGRVSEDEIRLARSAMHEMDLSGDQTREAMRHFNLGKQPRFDLAAALKSLHQQSASKHAVGRQLVALLLPILQSKHEPSAAERRVLWQVCQEFGISRVELAQLEAATRMESRFGAGKSGGAVNAADQAFALLQLSPDASDSQIKKAYRRLTNRYHPDKLSGTDATAVAMAEASRKTREIREAYELLRSRRGFK
ncbi:MAG: co-chaperone DjlA [Pseudomonadota bacterium]